MQDTENKAIQALNDLKQDIDAILVHLERLYNIINCLGIRHKSQAIAANEMLQKSC